jgi:hypothetical protein
MILRNKLRKLQLGGSLNQAQNLAPKMDIRWKQFDISGYQNKSLDIDAAMKNASSRSGTGIGDINNGLPSDIKYLTNKIQTFKNNMTTKLAGPDATTYSQSNQFKLDSDEIERASQQLAMLKSREDNYKTTKTKLQKNTDDYAIFNNKALVRDAEGGYKLVSTMELLTERTKDANGNVKPKYAPMSIGDALALRFNDENFSGFIDDTGGQLDTILSGVQDADTVTAAMDKMFSKVGSISKKTGKFIAADGSEKELTDVIGGLEKGKQLYSSGVTKTNEANLIAAMDLFTKDLNATQMEALKNKAITSFMEKYGNKEVDPAIASQLIEAAVNEDIASRALAYLKKASSDTTDLKGGAGGGDDLAKKVVHTNIIELARWAGIGETVQLEQKDWEDADELSHKFNTLATVDSTSVNIAPIVEAGNKSLDKGDLYGLAANPAIAQLCDGDPRNNLFLADDDSTPVASLNNGRGLETSAYNASSHGGPAKVLRGMPVKIVGGRKIIAWDYVKEGQIWGREYATREKAFRAANGRRPDDKERKVIISETNDKTGIDLSKRDPAVKDMDILMIPIVVVDRDRRFDDKDLNQVMQGDVSKEERLLVEKKAYELNRNIKRTYAFTVLSDNAAALQQEHYGPAGEVKNPVNIRDFIEHNRQVQSMDRAGFDRLDLVLAAAKVSPEIEK